MNGKRVVAEMRRRRGTVPRHNYRCPTHDYAWFGSDDGCIVPDCATVPVMSSGPMIRGPKVVMSDE